MVNIELEKLWGNLIYRANIYCGLKRCVEVASPLTIHILG